MSPGALTSMSTSADIRLKAVIAEGGKVVGNSISLQGHADVAPNSFRINPNPSELDPTINSYEPNSNSSTPISTVLGGSANVFDASASALQAQSAYFSALQEAPEKAMSSALEQLVDAIIKQSKKTR